MAGEVVINYSTMRSNLVGGDDKSTFKLTHTKLHKKLKFSRTVQFGEPIRFFIPFFVFKYSMSTDLT